MSVPPRDLPIAVAFSRIGAFPVRPEDVREGLHGWALCPSCGVAPDRPHHFAGCVAARPHIVSMCTDPEALALIVEGDMSTPSARLPALILTRWLAAGRLLVEARNSAWDQLSTGHMSVPRPQGAQPLVPTGCRWRPEGTIDRNLRRLGFLRVDLQDSDDTIADHDCLFASIAALIGPSPGPLGEWTAALRQTVSLTLRSHPQVLDGPYATCFPQQPVRV